MELEPALRTRAAAVTLIGIVLRSGQAFDVAFAQNNDINLMGPRDRAFIYNLCLTTLRRLGQIDALISTLLKHPLPNHAQPVTDILRIGACQILFLNVANHAAVSTCVELTRKNGHSAHIKLVNAVLRGFTRKGPSLVAKQDEAFLNIPKWLWDNWFLAYGEAHCREIAAAHLRGGALDLSPLEDPSACSILLNGQVLPPGTIRISAKGQIKELPGFQNGEWWVQDLAARMVAGLVGDVSEKSVLDLCAAPGGKTAYFAASGGKVTAVDRSKARILRLKENLDRLQLNAKIIHEDALSWHPRETADVVVLDAPCSATGTARRHPDVLWTKTETDVIKLVDLQRRLLRAAAEMVAPGGVLIFATCSLQPEEGGGHMNDFLKDLPNFSLSPVTSTDVHGLDEVISDPGVFRSLPCHFAFEGGMDGFFAARFRRDN